MFSRNSTLLLFIVLLIPFGCSNDSPVNSESGNEVPSLMDQYNVRGVSLAIIRNYQVDEIQVYGVKNASTRELVTEQTLFQAASISKSVSAMGALSLVQDGSIELHNNINEYLTSWQVPENIYTSQEKVTLARLLSHTGGLTVHGFRGYRLNEEVPTLLELLDGSPPSNSNSIRVNVIPGTIQRYSGGGYCIMQQAVIDLTQETFPDFLSNTILEPLELSNSTFEQPLPDEMSGQAATGYYSNGLPVTGDYHTYPELAAAGLWTTPTDLAKFLIELQLSLQENSNLVLNQNMTELMITPVLDSGYGLGISRHNVNGEYYFGHGGANEGFRCMMLAHMTDGVGIVVMTNSDNGGALANDVIQLIGEQEEWPGY